MDRDEIIRLAKEAGMGTAFYSQDNEPLTEELWGGPMRTNELERFAHLVAAEYKRDLEQRIAELEQALHEQIDQTMKMRDLRDRFDAESA